MMDDGGTRQNASRHIGSFTITGRRQQVVVVFSQISPRRARRRRRHDEVFSCQETRSFHSFVNFSHESGLVRQINCNKDRNSLRIVGKGMHCGRVPYSKTKRIPLLVTFILILFTTFEDNLPSSSRAIIDVDGPLFSFRTIFCPVRYYWKCRVRRKDLFPFLVPFCPHAYNK